MFNFLFVNLSLFSQAAASLPSCSSPQIRDCKFLKFSTSRSGVCEEISCGLHHSWPHIRRDYLNCFCQFSAQQCIHSSELLFN